MDKRFVIITNIDRGLIVRTWAHKHQGELAQMAYSDFIRLAPEPRELTGDQQYNVFLSYRSVNRAWVIALHDALVQAGHKVFLDQVALVVGANLRQSIENALMASQSGVLIWSSAANDSQWVRDEFDVLRNRSMDESGEFFFVPIRLDDSPLPPMLNNQLFLDFSSYPDGPNGGELLRLLHGIVGKPLSDEAMRYSETLAEKTRSAGNAIGAALENGDIDRLSELAESVDDPWKVSPQLGCKVAEAMIRLGNNDEADLLTTDLMGKFPRALRPKQLRAHVLTRVNSSETLREAKQILGELVTDDQRDPETLGLYAKTWFEDYTASGESTETRDKQLLRVARNHYRDGFNGSRDDTYCGINAATKTLLLGEPNAIDEAKEIAKEVRSRLPEAVTPDMGYWDIATIAEATLIAGDVEGAANLYQQAIDSSSMEKASHQSTFRNVETLCDQLKLTETERKQLTAPFS